jgi:hypothetical protein
MLCFSVGSPCRRPLGISCPIWNVLARVTDHPGCLYSSRNLTFLQLNSPPELHVDSRCAKKGVQVEATAGSNRAKSASARGLEPLLTSEIDIKGIAPF